MAKRKIKKQTSQEIIETSLSSGPADPETKPQEQPKQSEQPKPKFIVVGGLGEDGNFLFDIGGTEQTLTNLLGVQSFLNARVDIERHKKMGTGDALTNEIGKLLISMNTKLDRLLSLLEKPTNQL
jgi:hypothetical protein